MELKTQVVKEQEAMVRSWPRLPPRTISGFVVLWSLKSVSMSVA